jgi:hypothetical protein
LRAPRFVFCYADIMNLRYTLIFIIIILVLGIGYFVFFQRSNQEINLESKFEKNMIITSPSFQHNDSIPPKYTCDGENVNPLLEIKNVPSGAKSLALIVDDPDAPMGTWVHWTIWNINPDTTQIPEGSVPTGVTEGQTSFGKPGYGGPCPPSGTHRYFFKLYALDMILALSPQADKAELLEAMEGHILDKAELIGLYSRG